MKWDGRFTKDQWMDLASLLSADEAVEILLSVLFGKRRARWERFAVEGWQA